MRHLLGAILVISQTLILLPSQAQTVSESDNKSHNSTSITSEAIPSTNTNLPTKSNTSDEVVEAVLPDTNISVSSAVDKPSLRVPISSRVFNHPAMKQ